MSVRRLLPTLIVPLLALAACSAPTPGEPTGPGTSAPTSAPSTTEGATETSTSPGNQPAPEVELPAGPLGEAARWVLDTLAADSGPTEEEIGQRFAPKVLEVVPAPVLTQAFAQVRAMGPYSVTMWEGFGPSGVARLSSEQGEIDMQISVDGDLIDGLLFTPVEEAPKIGSVDDAISALGDRAQVSALLLADAECTAIEGRNQGSAMPIGSMFKLYVLGAVVTAVDQGDISWDDELTVVDELRSLPSGQLQEEPAGTKVTVAEAARLMISISDNTATDLLIHHVGRDAVEAELETMGHESPEMLRPFLTTREAFQLALSDPALRKQWSDTSGSPTDPHAETSEAQRQIVDALPAWDLEIDEQLAADPFWDESIDWFATATDLCRAHKSLQERATTEAGQPLREILSANPGVKLADADFVGFKGGSAPGEVGLSFWVERGDDTKVLVLQTSADTVQGVPSPGWLVDVAQQVLELS